MLNDTQEDANEANAQIACSPLPRYKSRTDQSSSLVPSQTDQLASVPHATTSRVLVEATPSPTHAVSAASASSLIERNKRNKTLPPITEHEDLDHLSDGSSLSSIEDEEDSPRVTPEDAKIAARQSAATKRSTLEQLKSTPRAPNAAFDSLGKKKNAFNEEGFNAQVSLAFLLHRSELMRLSLDLTDLE